MAASMSWGRFRGATTVSTVSPKKNEDATSLTAQVQSCCSVRLPVRNRCLELESLIRRTSSKGLHGVFPLVLDCIFGLGGQQGWDLHLLTSQYGRDDFKQAREFLSPRGALFTMIYKLLDDQYLRYEFPVDRLPAPTRESLAAGIVPPFYQGKIAYQPHGRAPSMVMLNAFEYYIYMFSYFVVSDRVHRAMNCWAQSQDCLYPVLLDQYLSDFLPSDRRPVPPIPVTSTPSPAANRLSPYRLPQYGVLYHYLHSYTVGAPENPYHPQNRQQRSPTQHGGSSLGLHHSQHLGMSPAGSLRGASPPGSALRGATSHSTGPGGLSFQQAIQEDPRGETWRSEVLVQALTEFWLNQNSLQVSGDKSFMSKVRENFIPSQDHVRVVRLFVKKLHLFVNSSSPPQHQSAYQQRGDTAIEELKRYILPVFVQKPLYVFLRHGFDNWPLDSSFRQILELWLSYIQPWRYVEETSRPGFLQRQGVGHSMSPMREPPSRAFPANEEKWHQFLRENVPFYTVLFQELLPRIFHQDLSIPNNALMVYRVTKVLGQPHLATAMREAEQHLVDLLCHPSQPPYGGRLSADPSFTSLSSSMSAASHPPHPLAALGSRLYTHLFEVEAPGFAYRPLFDDGGKMMIEKLMGCIVQAQMTVKTISGPSLMDITQTIKSIFTTSIRQANHSALFDDIGPVDTRKAENYLGSSADFLQEVFEVPVPDHDDTLAWKIGEVGRDMHLPPDTMDGHLTPLGRYQLMNRLRSTDVCFHGDPDLQPIRTYESTVLVRLFHSLSCQFNDAFGDQVEDACEERGLKGAMARWFFSPRGAPPTPDPTGKTPSWYRPRLSLRFLASYRAMLYVIFLYLLLWYLWDVTPVGFVLLMMVCALVVGFFGALREYWRMEMGEGERMFTYGESPQVRRHQHHHRPHAD